ncbi:MAG: hypothetical protein E6R07_05675 [Nevskiaceae bacterium]|nr:MAG: hypothetical protein E6R07_05675 [Nevskiaceae bacterium]
MRVLVVAAACAVGTLQAAAPPAPDANALQIDQNIQSLKDEVLQFNRDAVTLEQDTLYPPYSRTSVYLGVRIGGLLVKDFSIAFDDGTPQTFNFTDDEGRAFLLHNGLRRMLRANLAPGPHRIRADFSAQYADAKPSDAPVTNHFEAIFDKGYSQTDLELTLGRSTRVAKPGLTLKQWSTTR